MSLVDLKKLSPDDVNSLTNEELYSIDDKGLESIDTETVPGLLLVSKIRIEKMKRKDAEMLQILTETKKKNEETSRNLVETMKIVKDTKNGIECIDKNLETMKERFSSAIDKLVGEVGGMIIEPPSGNFKVSTVTEAVELMLGRKKIGVITGAGISVASGINTFRGPNGIYEKPDEKGLLPEEFLTNAYFLREPNSVWKWHLDFLKKIGETKPSNTHMALMNLLRRSAEKGVGITYVTQNIDSLEKKAIKNLMQESIEIFQIHGDIHQMRCAAPCTKTIEELTCHYDPALLVHAIFITSLMRPNVLWFDEAYTEEFYNAQKARERIGDCDLLVIVGTTLSTSLPRNMAHTFAHKQKPIIEINPEPQLKWNTVFRLQGDCEDIVPNLIEKYLDFL